ncbi:MAG: GNAT family N-acetyltransferase [Anaerolineae bacterium]|jgi:mycothiol synthase|nr:GNAT family N-acetyltransferase [Anaerolineae bacterium]MBT7074160.1 GNAT family N-acetyltransferase [Anaerolineae bacterium]MBT7781295.1 GNAT family N-acetyltransferase [Anaerolineae bacterium]
MLRRIQKFNFKNATNREYIALNICQNKIRAEQFPAEKAILVDEMKNGFKNTPTHTKTLCWVVWDKPSQIIIAYALIQIPQEDNLDTGEFSINILKKYRMKGLGKRLLSKIIKIAKENNRNLLLGNTTSQSPTSKIFMNKIGAEKGLTCHINELSLDSINQNLLNQWKMERKEERKDFQFEFWKGKYVKKNIEEIIKLHHLINQQPHGSLKIENINYSANYIYQNDNYIFSQGYERWIIFVKEIKSKKYVGYTKTLWHPDKPKIIEQEMTGVFPEFRNKGLAKWIKVEMLEKIITERPQARFIRTEIAHANRIMIKINRELGFKSFSESYTWQVKTEKVASYLEGSK